MTLLQAQVTIHMVSSLDGFIAKTDDSISWMESSGHYDKGVVLTEEDIEKYIKGIDCYVMGSKTYVQSLRLGWPYGDIPVVVVTHRTLKVERKNVELYEGDLVDLVNELRKMYKNIWMVGGADLTKKFIRLKLVNEIIISVMPVILGSGKLFFDYIGVEQPLHLKDVTAYKDGMVELTYEVK